MVDDCAIIVQQIRISFVKNFDLVNPLNDQFKINVHSGNPKQPALLVNRNHIGNHINTVIPVIIWLHPCRLAIFDRNIIPSDMLDIILIVLCQICCREPDHLIRILLPAPEKSIGTGEHLRIIAEIERNGSLRIEGKYFRHLFDIRSVCLHILRILLQMPVAVEMSGCIVRHAVHRQLHTGEYIIHPPPLILAD